MSRIIWVLCALVFSASAAQATPLTGLLLPPSSGGPVKVTVGLFYLDFASIDTVDQNFRASGELYVSWVDPRLAFDPKETHATEHVYRKGAIWDPDLTIVNAVEGELPHTNDLDVDPTGKVTQLFRFTITLASPFHFALFPFDRQTLPFIVESLNYSKTDVVLQIDKSMTGLDKRASLAEWTIGDFNSKIEDVRWNESYMEDDSSRAVFDLGVTRTPRYYLWKFVFPMFVITMLSWISFLIEVKDITTQLTTSITVVLVLIAFVITLDFSLPRIPYVTWMDYFQLICFIFVILAVIENITAHQLFLQKHEQAAVSVRNITRVVIPIAFFICQAGLILPKLL